MKPNKKNRMIIEQETRVVVLALLKLAGLENPITVTLPGGGTYTVTLRDITYRVSLDLEYS